MSTSPAGSTDPNNTQDAQHQPTVEETMDTDSGSESYDATPDDASRLAEGEFNLEEVLKDPPPTHPPEVLALVENLYPLFQAMWDTALTAEQRKEVKNIQNKIITRAGDTRNGDWAWKTIIPTIQGLIETLHNKLAQWESWKGPRSGSDYESETAKLINACCMLIGNASKHGLQPNQLVSPRASLLIGKLWDSAGREDKVNLNRFMVQANRKQKSASEAVEVALITIARKPDAQAGQEAIESLKEVNQRLSECNSSSHIEIDVSALEKLLNASDTARHERIALEGAKLAFCGIPMSDLTKALPKKLKDLSLKQSQIDGFVAECLSRAAKRPEDSNSLIRRWEGELQTVPTSSLSTPGAVSAALEQKRDEIAFTGSLVVQSQSQIQSFGRIEFVTKAGFGYRAVVNCGTEKRPYFRSVAGLACGKGEGKGLSEKWPRSLSAAAIEKREHKHIKGILHLVELDPQYLYNDRRRADGKPIHEREPITYFQIQWRDETKAWVTKTELSKISSKENVEQWAAERRFARYIVMDFFLVCQWLNRHPDTMRPLEEKDRNSYPWLYPGLRNASQQAHDAEKLAQAIKRLGLAGLHQPALIGSSHQPALIGSSHQPELIGSSRQPALLGDPSQNQTVS
ncbi:hypothetical protein H2203_005177 [Taxawa tesnikishii (nom. ined.)]|nr:hypothetical protein H2203_005177 [Dothideales sp. JES 119]